MTSLSLRKATFFFTEITREGGVKTRAVKRSRAEGGASGDWRATRRVDRRPGAPAWDGGSDTGQRPRDGAKGPVWKINFLRGGGHPNSGLYEGGLIGGFSSKAKG